MNDFIIKKNQILWFPFSLGLTGRAFKDQCIAYNNLVEKKADNNADLIDEEFTKSRKLRCE